MAKTGREAEVPIDVERTILYRIKDGRMLAAERENKGFSRKYICDELNKVSASDDEWYEQKIKRLEENNHPPQLTPMELRRLLELLDKPQFIHII